jgi:hypothetical protein
MVSYHFYKTPLTDSAKLYKEKRNVSTAGMLLITPLAHEGLSIFWGMAVPEEQACLNML